MSKNSVPVEPVVKRDASGLWIGILLFLCVLVALILLGDDLARAREAQVAITESNNMFKMFLAQEGTTRLQSFLAALVSLVASPLSVVLAVAGVATILGLARILTQNPRTWE